MSNANFIVQNGISVGGPTGATISADPATGAVVISAAPTAATPNPTALVFSSGGAINTVATTGGVASTANIGTSANTASGSAGSGNISVYSMTGIAGAGNISLTGNIIPSANITYDLGSKTNQFHSAYIGPGTLYINGTAVLGASTTGTPSINLSASANQNINIATNGGGVIQLDGGTAGGGYVQVKSPLQIAAGNNITSSDGNPIQFSNSIAVDNITSHTANNNLTLSANGFGSVVITGPLIIQGTETDIGTFIATTVQAGTIGNSGAVLYGTLNSSSASQPNVTTLTGLTGFGTSGVNTTASGNLTVSGTAILNSSTAFAAVAQNIVESINVVAGAINSTPTAYFNTGAVQYYTTSAGANWTQNLAFSSGTTLNSALAVGQSVTIAIMATQGATPYYMNGTLTVDGSSTGVTTRWQNGSAPAAGNASGIDIYTYSIIKTASTPTYTVLASMTQFK